MDEVFLIGNDASPSTKRKDPAEVYAKVVNDMYAHVVKERELQMIVWGDRLTDGEARPGPALRASGHGRHAAAWAAHSGARLRAFQQL